LTSIFGGFAFRAYSENENYVVIFNYFQKLYYIVRNTIAFALKKPRFKILLKKSQEDFDVIRLRKILINSHKNHSILSSNYTVHKFSSKSIEILPVGVSKYDALMKFCSYQFFDINKLFYFGNDSNDIECFYNLKNTIAPANSSTLIQSLARFVCDSNNSSGPCKYISEFLLGSDNENTNS
jgi:hydroxymethylpyrimidine pyrophosphatase-like HAD family hydrolase